MAGEGFEPSKAEPTDLQSVPFDRSGIPPGGEQFRTCAPIAAPRLGPDYEASRRRWASGRASSFFRVWFSIWRMRSRVTWNARPTSSSV